MTMSKVQNKDIEVPTNFTKAKRVFTVGLVDMADLGHDRRGKQCHQYDTSTGYN